MRSLTMLAGILFIGVGVYLVGNAGVTFLSVAFIVGLMFITAGIIEVLSYSSNRGENETRSWILTDGITTFVLGFLILDNKISADGVITTVLALWIITTGARNFVHAWERIEKRSENFYDHLIVGALNFIFGIYIFFNEDFFGLASIVTIGLCIVMQGINIFHIGATIKIEKPHFIKTKDEKLAEAAAKAEEAHAAAREAIRAAKEAKAELKTVEATPEEELDLVLAPKPVGGVEAPAKEEPEAAPEEEKAQEETQAEDTAEPPVEAEKEELPAEEKAEMPEETKEESAPTEEKSEEEAKEESAVEGATETEVKAEAEGEQEPEKEGSKSSKPAKKGKKTSKKKNKE